MKMILIDMEEINSFDEIHDIFQERLEFPEWYGRNLDALYDCLTDVTDDLYICIDHCNLLTERFPEKATAFLELLENLEEENSHIFCLFG